MAGRRGNGGVAMAVNDDIAELREALHLLGPDVPEISEAHEAQLNGYDALDRVAARLAAAEAVAEAAVAALGYLCLEPSETGEAMCGGTCATCAGWLWLAARGGWLVTAPDRKALAETALDASEEMSLALIDLNAYPPLDPHGRVCDSVRALAVLAQPCQECEALRARLEAAERVAEAAVYALDCIESPEAPTPLGATVEGDVYSPPMMREAAQRLRVALLAAKEGA